MKIIILAAGKGTRLMPLTRNTPKSLIDIGQGMTLLEKQLENIQNSGVIDEVVLVTGYLAEQIEAKMSFYRKKGLKIRTVFNPFFNVSNNLISLWLAKHEMNDDDFIITNGDNIFTSDIFHDLVKNTREGITLTISKKLPSEYSDDDMKVILSKENKVLCVSKVEVETDKAHAESPGLVKVSGKKHREIYQSILEELARNSEYVDKFWLETFNKLSQKGYDVHAFEIDGKNKWTEIDFHIDLNHFRETVEKKLGST